MDYVDPVKMLRSENLLCSFREAMALQNDDGFYDAELWLELARAFNPNVQIPEKFTEMQSRCQEKEKAQKWQTKMKTFVFPPEPCFSAPSFSRYDASSYEMNEIVSEYWAGVAARKEAEEIESLWCDLADCGFWDDTSWQ